MVCGTCGAVSVLQDYSRACFLRVAQRGDLQRGATLQMVIDAYPKERQKRLLEQAPPLGCLAQQCRNGSRFGAFRQDAPSRIKLLRGAEQEQFVAVHLTGFRAGVSVSDPDVGKHGGVVVDGVELFVDSQH